jgi:hypothetical protein
MRIVADKDTELAVPQLAGKIGDFQIVDFGSTPPHEEKGRAVTEQWFTLLSYDIGDKIVPGPSVQYRVPGGELASVAAPDALVVVQSLLDVPGRVAVEDVRDIKGPVAVPHDYRPLLWIGAAVLAVAALGGLLYRLLGRRGQMPLIIPRPAHEVALEALAKLRAARLIEEGRHGEFYVRLSDIVRTYLEVRFRPARARDDDRRVPAGGAARSAARAAAAFAAQHLSVGSRPGEVRPLRAGIERCRARLPRRRRVRPLDRARGVACRCMIRGSCCCSLSCRC